MAFGFMTAFWRTFTKPTHAGRANPANKSFFQGALINIMLDYANAREIIRQGISEGIDFAELRNRLPGIRKRPLMSLVFDVMHEIGTDQVPFPGMVLRPRLTRMPIAVENDGTLNILPLLKEKGFDGVECEARCHIGNDKITLTVRPVKSKFGSRQEKKPEQNGLELYSCFESIDKI